MIGRIKEKIVYLLVITMIFTSSCFHLTAANELLETPSGIGWQSGAQASAKWQGVPGADYYEVKVKVYDGDRLLGEETTGTSLDHTDLQQEIRNAAKDSGLDYVFACFCVKAMNTMTDAESSFSDYSERLRYDLNALASVRPPKDVRLSENGILSFEAVESATHYDLRYGVVGDSSFAGKTVRSDQLELRDGYYYVDISENIREKYLYRGHVGKHVKFYAFVISYTADEQASADSELSNAIDYYWESTLKTPVVSLNNAGDKWFLDISEEDAAKKYEIDIGMPVGYSIMGDDPYKLRIEKIENQGNFNFDTQYQTDERALIGEPEKSDGLLRFDITRMLRYYYQSFCFNSMDREVDMKLRVREVLDDDKSAYSDYSWIRDYTGGADYKKVKSVSINVMPDNRTVVLQFPATEGAMGYNVGVSFSEAGDFYYGRSYTSWNYDSQKYEVSNGIVSLDITNVASDLYKNLSGKVSLLYVWVQAYGDAATGNRYKMGHMSDLTGPVRYYPYDRPLIKKLELSPAKAIIARGRSIYLGKSVEPLDGYYENLEWSSDNGEIAAVDDRGMVTGVSEGRVRVRATADKVVSGSVRTYVYSIGTNIRDILDGEEVTGQAGDILDNIGNGTNTDLSKTDISQNALQNLQDEIRKGVYRGDRFYADVSGNQLEYDEIKDELGRLESELGISISSDTISANTASQNLVSGNNTFVASSYTGEECADGADEDVIGTDLHIGNILKTDSAIGFTLPMPYDWDKDAKHAGKFTLAVMDDEGVRTVPASINPDGTFSAKTDSFSKCFLLAETEGDSGNEAVLVCAYDVKLDMHHIVGENIYDDDEDDETGKDDDRGGETGKDDDKSGETGKDDDRGGETGKDDDKSGETGKDDGKDDETGKDDDRGGETGKDDDKGGETGKDDDKSGETGKDDDKGGETGKDDGAKPGDAAGTFLQEIVRNPANPLDITLNLVEKQKYTLTDIAAVKGTAYTLEYSGNSVAKINKKGVVKAKSQGSAEAKVTIGEKTYTLHINVFAPGFAQKKVTMKAGQSADLSFDSKGFAVAYSMPAKKMSILSVSGNGVATGKAKGKVPVTAVVNGRKYKVRVSVTQ